MVRPDLTKWNQSIDDLLQGSINAQHPRTRERYLALYMIASGQSNATLWAKQTNRCDESIMKWVHCYNEVGPDSLIYRRTGGSIPFCARTMQTDSSGNEHLKLALPHFWYKRV